MKHLSIAIACVIMLSACSPLYVPNLRNAPLFTKAGEAQGAMQYGTNGVDLQGAVAITNHIAVMGNYSYANINKDTTSNLFDRDNYHYHTFYEGALGFYKNEGNVCYEIFAGYGKGESSNYDAYTFFNSQAEIIKAKYYRVFIQPSIGMNKKIVNLAFTTRISMIDFTQFSNPYRTTVITKEPKVFLEPAVTARFNFLDNRLFGTVQAGFTTVITNDLYFKYRTFHVGTGIGFRLGGLKKEVETKN